MRIYCHSKRLSTDTKQNFVIREEYVCWDRTGSFDILGWWPCNPALNRRPGVRLASFVVRYSGQSF